jgi:hypothetical protein
MHDSMQNVIADSDPLGALFNMRDRFHLRAVEFFRMHGAALRCHTTWEVVSERMYFLDCSADALGDFLEWLHASHVLIDMPRASAMPNLGDTKSGFALRGTMPS